MPPETDSGKLIEQAVLLVRRLERISADSFWAHRSSGVRGSLLRTLEDLNSGTSITGKIMDPGDLENLARLIEAGYKLLENAAREY